MRAKLTVTQIRERKSSGPKITMVTAYDASSAALVEQSDVDIILVGDSLGSVMMGMSGAEQVRGVTMEAMIHHVKSVVRGAPNTFIVGDLPFGSYNVSPEQAVENANRLLAAGADSVKMECSSHLADTVRRMAEAAIPVMAHIGLRPQSVPPHEWRVQGRDEAAARQLIEDAKALEDAGAFAVLLEVVTAPLAAQITEALSVPTIGIGAGAGCDGQVLVWHDLLGLHSARPRHAKRYAELGETIVDALNHYAADVRSGAFPGPENSFGLKQKE